MNPESQIPNPQNPFIFQEMPDVIKWVVVWLDKQPIVATLLLIMALDVLCGIALAVAKKRLSSTISWRGMSRKVIMLLLVGVAAVIQPFAGGLPLSQIVGMFYIVTEAVSILENAAAAGVPLPKALIVTLAKLREDGEQKRTPEPLAPVVTPTPPPAD